MVSKGATTIWELWNGNTANPAMNSQNHVMLLGDLLIWLYEDQAGIKSDNGLVGFKKIQFAPYFDGPLDSVSAAFHSGYGWIKSRWIKRNGLLNWEVEIPPGSTAAVHLPVKLKEVKLDGKAVKGLENGGNGQLELGSGTYHIDGKLLNVQ
jgi:alpha-L-rhamnosidase